MGKWWILKLGAWVSIGSVLYRGKEFGALQCEGKDGKRGKLRAGEEKREREWRGD